MSQHVETPATGSLDLIDHTAQSGVAQQRSAHMDALYPKCCVLDMSAIMPPDQAEPVARIDLRTGPGEHRGAPV